MGSVITEFSKGEYIANVELDWFLFYEEHDRIYCDLNYYVTFKSGKVACCKIKKVNTGISTDHLFLESNATRNAIYWHSTHAMLFNNYTTEIIKEADPIEVTIEEIEKKFGRKVKIVDKKEDKKDDQDLCCCE